MTTSPEKHHDDPWRWLNWSAVLIFAGAVIMIALISAGVFDPKPIGRLQETLSLGQVDVGAKERRLDWLGQETPGTDFSLRLTAALTSGELDSAYGLAVGDETRYLVAAFSPTGYVAFWQQDGERLDKIIPWRTWPHIRPEFEANELWLDVANGQLTAIRTNREILWQGAKSVDGQRIGLWAQTFATPATFDFQQLEIFAEPPP
ncbi:MAG: hypothetical protein ACK2UH_07095 [Candidatus Promineifilaceae bacterium]